MCICRDSSFSCVLCPLLPGGQTDGEREKLLLKLSSISYCVSNKKVLEAALLIVLLPTPHHHKHCNILRWRHDHVRSSLAYLLHILPLTLSCVLQVSCSWSRHHCVGVELPWQPWWGAGGGWQWRGTGRRDRPWIGWGPWRGVESRHWAELSGSFGHLPSLWQEEDHTVRRGEDVWWGAASFCHFYPPRLFLWYQNIGSFWGQRAVCSNKVKGQGMLTSQVNLELTSE